MSITDKELQAIRAAAEAVQGRKLTKDVITLLDEVQRLRTQDEGIQIHASALRREWEEAVEARDEAVRQRGLLYEGLNVARQRLGFLGNWLKFTYKGGPDDVRCARGYEEEAGKVLKEADKRRGEARFPCGRCGGSKRVRERGGSGETAYLRWSPCPECRSACGRCGGSKEVWESSERPLRPSGKAIPCPECSPVCKNCDGLGLVCSCGDSRHVPCQRSHYRVACPMCDRKELDSLPLL